MICACCPSLIGHRTMDPVLTSVGGEIAVPSVSEVQKQFKSASQGINWQMVAISAAVLGGLMFYLNKSNDKR